MPREGKSVGKQGDRESTVLATQFALPPAPFGMVDRPRLVERLAHGLEQPVTLLCAPAGSGKTALLASAAACAGDPVAWVSLEPGDDEPGRFWGAVLASLRLTGAVAPESALATLAPPLRASHGTFTPLFVNTLAELEQRVLLVLDDVHVVRSRECLAQLSFLVLHAPSTLRLVLSARADPALPLHVPRVSGQLTEIRSQDLAFTVEETGELLRAHGLELAPDLVARLCARAEGWAAGLRLAALSLQGHAEPERFVEEFAGDDRVVGDYLIAEVLDRQPPRQRAFLLRTSLVDRVCADLADALTDQASGADMLAALERTNGFVLGLDAHREWYRYHRLFAKLLRTRARLELPGELPELNRRAARWYAERSMAPEALRHAVEAADWDLAVEVTAEHWFELFVRGHGAAIRSLVDALPPERLAADAELAAVLACTALDIGDFDAAAAHLARAEAAADALPESRRRRYVETMAVAALCRARLEGDFDAALAAADALLAEAGGHSAWSDDRRRALVHAQLGATALWAHRLDRAAEELRGAVALARAAGLDHVLITTLSDLGLLEAMVEGPAGAQASAREALALAAERGWSAIPQTACAHAALAMAAFYDLRTHEAAEHLERGYAAVAHVHARQVEFVLVHLEARMHGALGRPADGLRALERFALAYRRGAPPRYEHATLCCMRAHLLAIQGDLEAARAELAPVAGDPWLVIAVVGARLALAAGDAEAAAELLTGAGTAEATHAGTRVEAAVLLAIAYDTANDPARAAGAVERALALAERTGHRWPFLEAGRRMETLLRKQIRHGTAHRSVAGELLDAFTDRAPARHAVAPLLEPLSEREQAILRFLPTTLSNREIAAELFVTTNTVKTHLRSIYRKLDVARRREAVERARDLRLLSSSRR